MTTKTVTLRIKRGTPDEAGRFEDHRVPYRRGMSVLDAVMWIRGHVDSSLSIRYSCINANACKECCHKGGGEQMNYQLLHKQGCVCNPDMLYK